MTKAVVKTRSGAVITIEGTQHEVADLLDRFEGGAPRGVLDAHSRRDPSGRPTPTGLLVELIKDGFFSVPKELGTIRIALQEKGHFYPVTTLSPLLLRLVRSRELRRIKDKKHWAYVR